ncbi:RDD family protein [Microbacterium xanthum]|uniref:RDD family protein n=1 Tax=Microbacterium xanthum TaxID=3079794 RepID=UPI002AD43E02|nr:RDD family protein [Microbacterium sp. KSW-48]MDZ8171080.1 RDD family protein [Microbacterium sp. KSW-48]
MSTPAPAVASAEVVHIHQDEVLTGEAVALDVQPVGFFLRGLGALIDLLLGVGVLLLFVAIIGWLASLGLVDDTLIPIVSIVLAVFVMVVLPTTVETATRGRSLGKLAVGARIVRADGGASGFRQAFIRALTGVLEIWLTLGGLAAVVGAFTPRSQRLGDLLAGTSSERTRTPALPDPGPGVPPSLARWAETADAAHLPAGLSRRMAQFVRQAESMMPSARQRVALSLAEEAAAHVSPVPQTDAETFVRAVVAVRREREARALALQSERVARLTRGLPD